MEQLTLFDNPRPKRIARATDPATSRAAAEIIRPRLGLIEARMLRMFQQLGVATAREAAEECMACCNTGETDMETHRKRYTGLKDKRYIQPCGTKQCRYTGQTVTAYEVIK